MREFAVSVRVYYEDTDAGGVVYYANYMKFMERARTEFLRALGFCQDELARDFAVVFAVRSARLDFIKPARLDDMLSVTATLARQGNASMTFSQKVMREGVTLCEGEIKIACLDAKTFTPRAIPDIIVSRLSTEKMQ